MDERSLLSGRPTTDCEIRSRYGVIVVAVKRGGGDMTFDPDRSEPIQAGEVLVAMGKEADLDRLEPAARGTEG